MLHFLTDISSKKRYFCDTSVSSRVFAKPDRLKTKLYEFTAKVVMDARYKERASV